METKLKSETQINQRRPFLKHIHHTWTFWIVLFLMFVAIMYYIMTVDFAFAPTQQPKQSSGSVKTGWR